MECCYSINFWTRIANSYQRWEIRNVDKLLARKEPPPATQVLLSGEARSGTGTGRCRRNSLQHFAQDTGTCRWPASPFGGSPPKTANRLSVGIATHARCLLLRKWLYSSKHNVGCAYPCEWFQMEQIQNVAHSVAHTLQRLTKRQRRTLRW